MSLPETRCAECGDCKINGLFAPNQLKRSRPLCIKCVAGHTASKRIACNYDAPTMRQLINRDTLLISTGE
jgi:hypothetical protein